MLSSPFLSSPLLPPPKSLHSDSIHHLPTSRNPLFSSGFRSKSQIGGRIGRIRAFDRIPIAKNPILGLGFGSKRHLGATIGRVGVSGQKNMAELVGIDGFGGVNGSKGEGEAISRQDMEFGGFEYTLNKLSKWIVAALFGLVILWKHDAESMWIAMGSVVNSWLSMTLKQMLNHERPASALRSDPGMPSSHAQSIFYTAFFVVLSLFHGQGTNAFTVSVGAFTLLCGSYLSWLRVSQRLHTSSQVVVGAALGSACSAAWFWLWHSFVLRAFISSIWVRIIVVLGSLTFCVKFVLYILQHWLSDEQ